MKEILATFIAIAVALRSVSATTTLCVNGNNQLTSLFIDGVDFTDQLVGRGSYETCDCVEIPPSSGVIAIEALSRKDPNLRTIQVCDDASPAAYGRWRCKQIGDSMADDTNWRKPDFNDKNWPDARYKKCLETCRRDNRLNCQLSRCFWSDVVAKVYRYRRDDKDVVRCRIQQCAEGCSKCKKTGPGSCDPGKCTLGMGVNAIIGEVACNKKCRLHVDAYKSGSTGDAYIKVTDVLTNSEDIWIAGVAGNYFATIDMSRCAIASKNFNVWPDVADFTRDTYQPWNAPGSNMVDIIAVELGVGSATESYAPWISVHRLGYGDPDPLQGDNYVNLEADLTGVQYGPVTYNNNQTVII